MTKIILKVGRIGNSRGVRIPAQTLERLGIGDSVLMEERSDGIFLRPVASGPLKLSWAQTAVAMVAADEDWTDWTSLPDGQDSLDWDDSPIKRVAEPGKAYVARKSGKTLKSDSRKGNSRKRS